MISKTLKETVIFCVTDMVLTSKGVLVHFLGSAGATALLCTIIDTKKIKLIGCWHRNEILRYLHVQAEPITSNFFSLILPYRKYSFTSTMSPLATNPAI